MDDKDRRESSSLAETMEKYSQIEGATPREKMANAYAQMRARANGGMSQNADPSATPSSAGDIEPSAPVSVPETAEPLSIRVEKEHALPVEHEMHPPVTGAAVEPTEIESQHFGLQTIQPSALTVTHVEEPSPGSVHLGPSEFAVPLPMDSRVKDDYERILEAHSQNVQDFLKCSYPQENIPEHDRGRVVSTMYNLLRQLSNVTTHPDLNITEHIKDSSSDLKQEAAWAEYSSAKFLFLGYLAENATDKDIHLVVMVHGEKTQKVVERYLAGKGLVYTRPRGEMGTGTNLEVSMMKGSLSFGIQSTQNDGVIGTYRTPSAIIAMDSSFSPKNPMVEHMRTTFARDGNLLPAIRLVVSNSSEHVELCFPNFPELRRLYLLVQYTMRLRDVVGDLQDDALGVQEDAEEIITYLVSDNFNAHWSLPLVEPLHIVDAGELDLTQSQHPEQSGNGTPFSAPQIQKRLHTEEESSGQSSKRPRTETSQEASQQTESTKFPSQTLDNDLHLLERHLVQLRSSHATEVESLRKALTQAQSGLQEKEKALETLQHRYESRTQEFHRTRQERDRLNETKSSSEQRVERQKEELMKLKDERTQLRHELEKAREELKSGGGSIAELEAAREEIRRLGKENANLERKADYEAKQAEYTREQYQNASTTAAQSVNEVRQLRQENEALKRKVDGNAVQLRELNLQNDEARHLARVHEVEAMLRFREDLLRRKEDELREIRKNRPSTRSTSTQPRSPKITANSRPTSPGIGGRGSGLRFSSEMSLP
ncbi:class II histone deacetylase complex subunits 2 and 3-domain-containing protein [Aspergillus taichungensis]|uniref:Class II histone deacetylase complex subunits 2 and 3-domain-containing protein n=1 Tax=Aspergillus taichungensis TaxID=482145 RepID=A0A2J5HS38_9EURO|nr:class II histone deacetylase complex subunits 2 and 3-domain-containing protein [Aspergillus taichungensis]